MGGPGSGRAPIGDKAVVVEDCLSIDLARFVKPRCHKIGRWEWLDDFDDVGLSVRYELCTESTRGWLRLDYQPSADAPRVQYAVPLQVTFPHFGGVRWWRECCLTVDGQYCGRRVRKLYRPPGQQYFGCRHCHQLTYLSSQTHDKRLSALVRRMLSGQVSLTAAEDGPLGLRLAMHQLDRSAYYERGGREPLEISD